MKKLLCIDGNSIINRTFYGIRLLTTKDGFPTNALYGFINIIMRELKEIEPDYTVIAYDLKSPTFRHKLYAHYKAGRHSMPDELRMQMPVSREFAEMLGLHILDMEGYEADDIIGTVTSMAEADPDGCMTYILTGDRDLLQLISPKVHIRLAGNHTITEYDENMFIAKYGIRPDQFVDVKALMGDTSDNIPGVAGIGEKTAIRLISEYRSLNCIYECIETYKFAPSLHKKLNAGKERAYMSQTLARIYRDVPLSLTMDMIRINPIDKARAYDLFMKYEFMGFIKRIVTEEFI